jgi:hypothetical protein
MIFHGIHRELKHISVVACILVSGDYIIPSAVFSRVGDAIIWKIKIEGFESALKSYSRNGRSARRL